MSSIFDTFGDDEEAPARAGPAVSVPERPAPAAPTTAPKKGGSIFDTFGDDEGDAPVATPATPKEDWWEEWKRKQNEAGTGHEPAPAPVTPTPAQPTPAAPKPVDSGDTGDWWEDWKRKQNEAGTPKEEAKPVATPPVPIAGAPPLTGPESDKQIPERKDNTWEDYLHAARSGTGGVVSAIGAFIDYSFPETPWHTRVGENIRQYGHEQSRQELEQMSPDAKRRLQESIFQKDEFWSRLGLKTVASVPSMIATLPAGVAGPMGIAAMSYALQSGGTYDDIKESFNAIPADKLKEMSPAYEKMLKNGFSDQEARSRIASNAAGILPMASGVVSAVTSKFGLESAVTSKIVTGVGIRLATGRIGAAGVGAAGEAFQEAAENGSQEYAKQQAEINAGTRKEIDWTEVWSAAGEGAVIGAVMGGPTGAVVGPEHHAAPGKTAPGTEQTATPGGAEQSETHGPAQGGPTTGGPGQASPGGTSATGAQPPPDAPAQAAAADSAEPTPAKQPPPDTLAPAGITVTEAGAVPAAESEALKAATGVGGEATAAPAPAQSAVPLGEGDLAEEVTTQSPGYYANTDPAEAAAIGALAANRPPPVTAPTPPPAPLEPAAPAQAAPAAAPPPTQPVAPAPPAAPVAPPPAMASSPAPAPAAVPPAPPPTAATAPPPPLTPQAPPQPAQATVVPEPAPVAAAPAPAPTVAAPEAALPPQPVSGAEEAAVATAPAATAPAVEPIVEAPVAKAKKTSAKRTAAAQAAPPTPPMAAVNPQGIVQATPDWQEMPKGGIVPGGAQVSADPDTGKQYIRQPPTQAEQAPFDLGQWQAQQPTPAPKPAATAKAVETSKAKAKVSVAEKPAPAAKTEPAPAVAPTRTEPASAVSPAKVEATPPTPTQSTFETLPPAHQNAATRLSERMSPDFENKEVRIEAAARAVRDLAGNENLPPGSLKRLFQQHYASIEEEQEKQARIAEARPRVEAVAKKEAVKAEEKAAEVKAEPRKKVRGETRAVTPAAIRDEKLETTVRRAKAEVAEKGENASPAAKRVMEGVEKQASGKRADEIIGAGYKREGRELYAKQAEEEAKKVAPPTVEQQLALEGEGAEKVREAIQQRKREAALKKTAENEAKAKDILEKAELPTSEELSNMEPGEWIKELQDAVRFIKQQIKEQGVEVPERHQTLRGPHTNLLTLIQNESKDGAILGPKPDLNALTEVAMAYQSVVHDGDTEGFAEQIRANAEDLGAGAASYNENDVVAGKDEEAAPESSKPLDEILRFRRSTDVRHTPAQSGQSYTSSTQVQSYPENTKVKPIQGKTAEERTIYNVQSGVSIKSKKVLKASEMLRAEKANFKGDITPVSKAIWKRLDEILAKALPDFEIHIVSNEDVEKLFGRKPGTGKTGGVYSLNDNKLMSQGKQGVLILNEQFWNGPQVMQRGESVTPGQVLRHELVHALSELVIQDATSPFRNALYHLVHETQLTYIQSLGIDPRSIDDQMIEALTADIYGFTDPAEFLSEAYSNPQFQSLLATLPVTQHMEQAVAGIPQATAWDKFIRIVTQMLKLLGYGKQGMSSLEAVIRLGDTTLLSAEETTQYAKDFLSQKRKTDYGYVPQPGMVTQTDLAEFMRQDNSDPFAGSPRNWQSNAEARFRQWLPNPTDRTANEWWGTAKVWAAQTDSMLRRARDKQLLDVDPADGRTNLDRWQEAIEHEEYLSKAEREEGQQVLKTFSEHWGKWDPAQQQSFIDVGYGSTLANIHPDEAIGIGKNQHVSTTELADAGKREAHKNLSAEYNNFTPDMKAQFKEVGDYFAKMQRKKAFYLSKGLLDTWIADPAHSLPAGWTVDAAAHWVADGGMEKPKAQQTAHEQALLTSLGKFGKSLKESGAVNSIEGYYLPLSRRGDWVIAGKQKIDPMTGVAMKDGRVAFNTEAEAEAFLKQNPSGKFEVQAWMQDPTTGQWQRVRQGTAGATVFATVKTTNDYVEFFESQKEAARRHAEIANDPSFQWESPLMQPAEREAVFHGTSELGPGALKSMLRSIDQLDLGDGLKGVLKTNATQAASRLMRGNRIKQHLLARRNVAGFSTDFAHNLSDYVDASASDIASMKQSETIRKYEKLVDQEVDQKSHEKGAADERRQIVNEFKRRVKDAQAGKGKPGKLGDIIQRTGFMTYLASPRYWISNMMQLMWTFADLAAEHGPIKAGAAIARGAKSLGYGKTFVHGLGSSDTLVSGALARVRASGHRRAAQHYALLKHMQERGRLDLDTMGMEVQKATKRSDTGIKQWEQAKALTRTLEDFFRRVPQAVELMNRVPTAIAAYELARGRDGTRMTHEQAVTKAMDAVNKTQFNYDSMNQPRAFNMKGLKWLFVFKKFAAGAYSTLANYAADVLRMAQPKNWSDKAKWQQASQSGKALIYLGLMHWAVGGMAAAMLEPLKLFAMGLAAAFGEAPFSDDWWIKLRKRLAQTFLGPMGASALIDGPLRTFGRVDLSGSINLSQLATFDTPESTAQKDVLAYFGKQLIGAPGAMLWNMGASFDDFRNGRIEKGLEKLIPLKWAKDAIKAERLWRQGAVSDKTGQPYVEPISIPQAIVQSTGIKPQSVSRQEEKFTEKKAEKAGKQERNDKIAEIAKGRMSTDPDDKKAAREAQREWNKTHKGDEKITEETILRSIERRKKNRKDQKKENVEATESW